MTEHQIAIAAMRWHAANIKRLEAGAVSNQYKRVSKATTEFGGADIDLSRRVTEAKRVELAALRALAKICAMQKIAQKQVTDVETIDMPVALPIRRLTDLTGGKQHD